jgi:uncharacterized membrane protein (UPF0182 family)
MSENTITTPIDNLPLGVQHIISPAEANGVARQQRHYGRVELLNWIVPVAILLIGALTVIPSLLQKWLWMRELNYVDIFWTLCFVKCGMTCVAFIGAFLFLWINVRQAARNSFALSEDDPEKRASSLKKTPDIVIQGIPISRRVLAHTLTLAAAVVAVMFALGFYTQWDTYLRFYYGGPFGSSDPIFGVDMGFYLFRLPFYQLLQGSLVSLTALAIVAVVFQYVYFAQPKPGGTPFHICPYSFSSWLPL